MPTPERLYMVAIYENGLPINDRAFECDSIDDAVEMAREGLASGLTVETWIIDYTPRIDC